MKQKSGKMFNLFVVLSMLLGMIVTPALAASGSEAQTAPAAPVTQEDAAAKIDPQVLLEIKESGATEFFVWMKEKADLSPAANLRTKQEKGQFVFEALRATAERTQKDLRAVLDAQGVEYRPFYIANKILVRSGGEALAMDLAARPDVAKITPNQKYQLQEPFKSTNVPESPAAIEPNITFIYAPDVWGMGIDGQGTLMAGNDTGLDWDHPAIINKYRGWDGATADHNYNWWDATGTYPSVPNDGHGHGTHTTGTMVGDDGAGNQIGVAPGAQTVHCKNMTDGGSGDDGTFSECFEWDLAPWDLTGANPNPMLAPDAINNSWGYWGGNAPQFQDEVDALQAAGIVVEVSAGNEGSACTTLRSPGDYQQVMTTGSVNHTAPFPGSLTGFSSRGPSLIDPADYMPDIMAPGENIRSSVPGGGYEGGWSGTSMAGPHATALIGLMWSANPALKGQVDLTYQIIQETAEPLTGVTGSNCGGDYTVGPNNDWGFGTINALAAVEAAIALGGAGFLEGTVTDSSTSDPLEDVSIVATMSPTQTYSTMTDEFGYYGRYLPEGTYEVNASKYGYIPETVTDIVITEDVTTTLDFTLDPAPSATVYGYVYDSTTGWPLYAQITVAGVPDGTLWNDPVTGYYEVTLPRGTTYDFHIEAWVGGYLPYDVSIGPLDGDTEANFYLAADLVACNAPGYELQAVAVMTEYFDAVTPPALPAGWAAADVNGTVGEWQTNAGTVHPTGGGTHSAPNLAYFNSYSATSGSETRLYQTADMDLSGLTDAQVWLWMYHDTGYSGNNDRVQLQVSTDAGATWQNAGASISRYDGSVGWKQHTVDISAYAGLAGVRLGLLGTSAYGNDVHVDDVGVFQTSCLPLEGGLVLGNVYDANTLDDLTGAMVENEAGYSFTTQATADPAVGDAFYTLFSPGGEQTFTASFTDAYGSDVEVVDVVDGSTVAQDFSLGAGWLEPDPDALSVDVELYQTDTVSLTLYNLGNVDLTFEIKEKDKGFVPGVLAGEDILVVAYDTSSAAVAEAALAALGYTYLEVSEITFAAMPVEDLLEYQAVVFIGIPYTGGPQEKAIEYMDAGGSFMVADNDVGYAVGSSVFYTTYLQATYLTDAGSDGVVVGTDIMAGISTDISGDPYPDDFLAGADAVGIFDAPSGNLAGSRIERNDYQAIYLAWDFAYTGAAQQVPIMDVAMGYLAVSDVPWLSTAPITGTIPGGGMPSFGANLAEAGVSSTAAPQGYAPKLTQSTFAPDSPAAGVVAVFKDVNPWNSTSTETILAANSIPYEVHGSADFATLDFSAYGMIVISSDQPQAFYDAYALNVAKFEAYVNGGGVLNFFAADNGWNGGFLNAPLPGGITYTFLGESYNVVDDPAHPVVAGIPNPFSGGWASHGVFSNLPAGAHVIASGQSSGSPTILEYQMGSGRLLAFATTLEISYDGGWEGGPILLNTLLYGYNQTPNNSVVVDVTFDASVPEVTEPGTYMAELQIKNDTPYGRVTVPVTMNVTAPAYLGKLDGTVSSMGYCDANPFPAEGALVVIEDTYGITYTATADASGYYYKWLDEAGSPYTISVTAPEHDPGYASGVIVTGQQTTTQDFNLRWLVPCVGSDPDALSATLQLGANETQVLTLENAGGGAMDFEFIERDQGMIPAVKSSISLPASDGNFPRGSGAPSSGAAPVVAGGQVAPSAPIVLPTGTTAYAVEAGNSFFTAFDLDVPQVLPNLAPYATVDFPGAGEYVDGYVYVVDGTTMKQLDLTGAVINTIPVTPPPGSQSYTGMALDPTDGTVYLASCDITTSNLYTLDVATGTVTPIGQITNSPCTIGIAVDGTGAMYGHDIVIDSLVGIDKASGAGTVIGSLGFDANFGQGMGWDPATDTLYLAAFNYTTFLAELRIADRSTGNTVLVGVLGETDPGGTTQVPFLAVPIEIGGDVPWLSEDPLAGTIPADDSLDTDITFDAGQVTQPGEYYADLIVSSNDPENNKYTIPVTLTVTAPADWGKLEGTVTSLGYCDANPALVEGAEVLVTTTSGVTYTLTTDVNGYYVNWFPESESPLTIKVNAPEHTEGYAEDVVITGGATTTVDFDLRWLMPCVGADPTTFSVDVPEGTMLTENLALTNSGAEATSFEVSEQPVTGAAAAAPAKVTPFGNRLDLSLSGSPNLAGAAQPWAPSGDVELVLDDGSAEDSIGLTAGGQFIWFNRFTPTEDQFPLVIDQISLLMNNTTAVGASLQLLVYEDTDGDGDPATGAVLLGYEYVTVQYNDMMTWNVYDLASPVTLFGPGDVLIGVVNRSGSSGLLDFPAAIDQSPSSQYRSWIGYYGENPPEEPALPAPDLWGIIDDFGLPGNWTLRASGYTGSQDVPWLSEDPVTGTLEADSFFDIAVTFDSMTYTVGTTLDAMLKVTTDDPNSPIEIPVTMNVVAWEYGVDAMLENDALSGMPGETVTYTVMVTNTGNVPDVFDVVVSDDDWTTQAPPSVALGAGESAALQVTVEIPADAADGDWDEATCTFTSQGDPTKSTAATMTTTAEVPYEFGVELLPATDAKAGAPGAMVAYVLQLTNTGDVTDTFDLAVGSVEGWLVDFSATEFTLGAGETAEVTVHVTVPADAVEGDGDVTTVTATSQGDGSVAASSELTTTAVFPKIFLPVIPQGFSNP